MREASLKAIDDVVAERTPARCAHKWEDDGDNMQLVCVKCGARHDVQLTAAPMVDPDMADDGECPIHGNLGAETTARDAKDA